ncbi:MAG: hypothetical protein IPI05_04985 [Flavobacteriales bacterium]|nr:hypothetical protein [Flavobacteriales bacterium]
MLLVNDVLTTVYCVRPAPLLGTDNCRCMGQAAVWAARLAFFLRFSPMMATRHMLLINPRGTVCPIAPARRTRHASGKAIAVFSATTLGVPFTVSDREFAGFYRDACIDRPRDKARTTGTVWLAGALGLAMVFRNGRSMAMHAQDLSRPMVGDILVIPEDYDTGSRHRAS